MLYEGDPLGYRSTITLIPQLENRMRRLIWIRVRRRVVITALRWWRAYFALAFARRFAFASIPFFIIITLAIWHFRGAIHVPKTGTDAWIDIFLGTVLLAIVPFAMAAYGGHIAAESIPEPKRRRKVKLMFWGACVLGVLFAFVQQYRAVNQDAETKSKTGQVEGAILGQLQSLHEQGPILTPEQVEANRRENILAMLRGEYILQHDNVSAGIIEGTEALPSDWVDVRLKDLREQWTVAESPRKASQPAEQKSYISWSGAPSFGRMKLGGDAHFQVGDLFGFNVDYINKGPNAVEVTSQCQSVFVEPDDSAEAEKRVVTEFKNFCAAWVKVQPHGKSTMTPGLALWVSAFAPEQSSAEPTFPRPIRRITQDDLDKLKSAREFAFVVAEINYIDNGKNRQLRMCSWLQPPADPPGIWHYCGIFN
ncbi:MAG: hypothetical protein WCA10_10200 [Terracidiphilus sp.]